MRPSWLVINSRLLLEAYDGDLIDNVVGPGRAQAVAFDQVMIELKEKVRKYRYSDMVHWAGLTKMVHALFGPALATHTRWVYVTPQMYHEIAARGYQIRSGVKHLP